jgi:hypothetical protein
MCVSVSERERERERQTDRQTDREREREYTCVQMRVFVCQRVQRTTLFDFPKP